MLNLYDITIEKANVIHDILHVMITKSDDVDKRKQNVHLNGHFIY